MNLELTVILIVALFSISSASNSVLYRINVAEPEIIDNPDGNKWMGNPRSNYFRDVISRIHPEQTTYLVARASHPDCKHHYVSSYGNVPQVGGIQQQQQVPQQVQQQQQQPGYARMPVPAYPYPYPYQGGSFQGYPGYYFYNPAAVPQLLPPGQQQHKQPVQQQQQPQTQQQQQQVPNDQYLKQPVQYEKVPVSSTVSPSPPPSQPQPTKPTNSGFASVTYPPIPTSTWQNYLCSLFPYLGSCQVQTQQASVVSPYGYQPYPGYQQLAQYPVYYIVQPEVKPPPAGVVGGPAPVGVIKITGPTPVKSEVGEKPQQVVKVEVDVKKGENEKDKVSPDGSEDVKTSVEESSVVKKPSDE